MSADSNVHDFVWAKTYLEKLCLKNLCVGETLLKMKFGEEREKNSLSFL